MSLAHWVAFVEVCRTGSISAASDRLGYTQSAVSRQVGALERDVGVPLLVRGPRGVRATREGEAFLHHARVVVSESRRAVEATRVVSVQESHLVVGSIPSASAWLVPEAIRAWAAGRASARWTVLPSLTPDLVEAVREARVDVAIVSDAAPGLPRHDGLSLTLVAEDEPVVVVARDHPSAGSGRVDLRELAEEHWIEDNDGSASTLRRLAAQAGATLRIDRSASDLSSKIGLVAAGLGVALVPGLMTAAIRSDASVLRIHDAPRRGIYALASDPERHRDFVSAVQRTSTTQQ